MPLPRACDPPVREGGGKGERIHYRRPRHLSRVRPAVSRIIAASPTAGRDAGHADQADRHRRPPQGKEFEFDGLDTFLVGRTADAHLRLSFDDPYFSRRHFVVEVNPPRCRLLDLNSRNGTLKNGVRVHTAEVHDGDEIGAGHTVFKASVLAPVVDAPQTHELPVAPPTPASLTRSGCGGRPACGPI